MVVEQSDPSTVLATGSGNSFEYSVADEGDYDVTFHVEDRVGDVGTATLTINAANAAPVVTIDQGNSLTVAEGVPVQLTGSFTDAGNDTATAVNWEIQDGLGTIVDTGTGLSYQFNQTIEDIYTVTLSVTDNGSAPNTGIAQMEITFVNAPPSVEIVEGDELTVQEGDAGWMLTASGSDVPEDGPISYHWQVVSPNDQVVAQSGGDVFSFIPDNNGDYTIILSGQDNVMATGVDSLVLHVTNQAPQSLLVQASSSVAKAGTPITFNGSFADPGADQWTGRIDFGDGTVLPLYILPDKSFSVDHVYLAEGEYTVNVTIRDEAGIDSGTLNVTINPQEAETQGTKWNDVNGDGQWFGAGEIGLVGWTIYIDNNNNGILDNGEPFTVTDSSGNYSFANLQPGNYVIREELQPGWQQTFPVVGSWSVSLAGGQTQTGIDFGNQLIPVGDPDLVATSFNVISDHVLRGQAEIAFTVENMGNVAAGPFEVHFVLSQDNIIGNGESGEEVVVGSLVAFGGLAAGASETRTVLLHLDRQTLFGWANADNPIGQGVGFVSPESQTLGLVVDVNNSVAESNEGNNSNQGQGIDTDNITYFPWDLDGDGQITPVEALALVHAIGTNDPDADLDGDGMVSSLEALGTIQRIGYIRNDSVIEANLSPEENNLDLGSSFLGSRTRRRREILSTLPGVSSSVEPVQPPSELAVDVVFTESDPVPPDFVPLPVPPTSRSRAIQKNTEEKSPTNLGSSPASLTEESQKEGELVSPSLVNRDLNRNSRVDVSGERRHIRKRS